MAALAADLSAIRTSSPVVLNLTNYVAMDLTANALLAVGASPIMAHAEEEMETLVALAGAVVINIGTLDPDWLRRMHFAAQVATRLGKPLVLDPVGAGATAFRTDSARDLLRRHRFTVLRGNASEVAAVLGNVSGTHGVDSVFQPGDIVDKIPENSGLVVSISGQTDLILHLGKVARVQNGDAGMTRVTAMGCTASSLTAAFLAVNPSAFRAATHAMAVMGWCGQQAARDARGPGSLRSGFLDALSLVDGQDMPGLKMDVQ